MLNIDGLLAEWYARHALMEANGPIPPHHDHCLGCGPQNPHGFAIKVRSTDTGVEAIHTFDERHVGAPGIVHGGAVAAVLDDLFGFLLFKAGGPAVTRQLTVDYLAPLLLEVPYTFSAAIDGIDGRKLNVSASVAAPGGKPVAEASALFIMVDIDHFRDATGTKPA
ncbi:MAG: PaaI family thioesterase [Marmoricola sp.]